MSTNLFKGTWRLISFEARTSSGEVSYPLGRDAAGFLVYGQGGYMVASVMRKDRADFNSADILRRKARREAGRVRYVQLVLRQV